MLSDFSSEKRDSLLPTIDPLTDLFFVVAALFLVFLAFVIPRLEHKSPSSSSSASAGSLTKDPAHQVASRLTRSSQKSFPVIFALPDEGIWYRGSSPGEGEDGHFVPLSALLTDEGLERALKTPQKSPWVLVIAQGGEESAFVLEGLFYRASLSEVVQIRLDRGCGFAKTDRALFSCLNGGFQ